MSPTDFEYGIKKDVRNNLIVREIDRNRQRELWRSVLVGVFFVAVLLFSAWLNFELIRHGYVIERMRRDRVAEEEINRRLRLEVETLKSPERIERLAIEELQLVSPRREQAIILDRIPITPLPNETVIVSR
jgi:cell division protein FtsL